MDADGFALAVSDVARDLRARHRANPTSNWSLSVLQAGLFDGWLLAPTLASVVAPAARSGAAVALFASLHRPAPSAKKERNNNRCSSTSTLPLARMIRHNGTLMRVRVRRLVREAGGVLGALDVFREPPAFPDEHLPLQQRRKRPWVGHRFHFIPAVLLLHAAMRADSLADELCPRCHAAAHWVLVGREDTLWLRSPLSERVLAHMRASQLVEAAAATGMSSTMASRGSLHSVPPAGRQVFVRNCLQFGGASQKAWLVSRRHALPLHAAYALGFTPSQQRALQRAQREDNFTHVFNAESLFLAALRANDLTPVAGLAVADGRVQRGRYCYCHSMGPECLPLAAEAAIDGGDTGNGAERWASCEIRACISGLPFTSDEPPSMSAPPTLHGLEEPPLPQWRRARLSQPFGGCTLRDWHDRACDGGAWAATTRQMLSGEWRRLRDRLAFCRPV